MKKGWRRFVCLILAHDWTCKAAEGVKPTEIEQRSREGFLRYASEWCRRCETVADPGPWVVQMAETMFDQKPTKRSHSDRWEKTTRTSKA